MKSFEDCSLVTALLLSNLAFHLETNSAGSPAFGIQSGFVNQKDQIVCKWRPIDL